MTLTLTNKLTLSFPNVKIDWNSRGYIMFDMWYSKRTRDLNNLLIEHQRNVYNKTVVWSAACPISDLFGKGEQILRSAYTSPNISSSLPNKSDIR